MHGLRGSRFGFNRKIDNSFSARSESKSRKRYDGTASRVISTGVFVALESITVSNPKQLR